MKKWEAPVAEVQMFAANEYVAACGCQDHNPKPGDKFHCTKPNYNPCDGKLYKDTNRNGVWDSEDACVASCTDFCEGEHIITEANDVVGGFLVDSTNVATSVSLYCGGNDNKYHCKPDKWEVSRS